MNIRENVKQIEKKTKEASSSLKQVRKDFRSLMGEERLNSFMTEILII